MSAHLRSLFTATLGILLCVAKASDAFACTCAVASVEDQYERATHVYLGRVVSTREINASWGPGSGIKFAKFERVRAFKGRVASVMSAQVAQGSCASSYLVGSTYVVFAFPAGTASPCGGTQPYFSSRDSQLLLQLERLKEVARLSSNPSLERTSTGLALGPRSASGHHPSRGPSANPVGSAQLKR